MHIILSLCHITDHAAVAVDSRDLSKEALPQLTSKEGVMLECASQYSEEDECDQDYLKNDR